MRSRHYSDTKLFVWLRSKFGIIKPVALGWGEWGVWEDQTKKDFPVGYWMTEVLPCWLEKIPEYTIDLIMNPIYAVRYYCRNRFIRQTHVLPTYLKVGDYYDLDTRILHGLMESLVDFVEIELAWMESFEPKRDPEVGLKYLAWEMTLDDPGLTENERSPSQAATARTIKELYDWWKVTRPQRPDPMDASGWSSYCDNISIIFQKKSEEEEKQIKEMLDKTNSIEAAYDLEDEQMLIKIIKMRKSLWT